MFVIMTDITQIILKLGLRLLRMAHLWHISKISHNLHGGDFDFRM